VNLIPDKKYLYIGTKFNNKKDGLGLEIYPDSQAKYFGRFINGKRVWAGKFVINNDDYSYYYNGEIKGVYANGFGWHENIKEQVYYEGMWKNSKKEGYGIEKYIKLSNYDRKNVIEESGTVLNFCQEGCEMIEFDNKIQKAKCDCVVEETKTVENLEDVNFPEIVLNKLLGELKSSNYLVMKCYNLLFDFELLKNNIGFFFMMPIFISTIALFIVYIIKGKRKLVIFMSFVEMKCLNIWINMID
jgi:hypothetical protein